MINGIVVGNVNSALVRAAVQLKEQGVLTERRGMKTLEFPGPFITEYMAPDQCVLFHPLRDANPFFHFFEALWMIAGRRDAAFLAQFAPHIATYAEEDGDIHGAYGHRIFEHHGNQYEEVLNLFNKDIFTRRAVISMWTTRYDLAFANEKRDVPCNTQIYFSVSQNVHGTKALNMTVCNRSNDMIWGAYGANAVHFAFLMELMRCMIQERTGHQLQLGSYYQFSNNLHVYVEDAQKKGQAELWNKISSIDYALDYHDPYASGRVEPTLRIDQSASFIETCKLVTSSADPDEFYRNVRMGVAIETDLEFCIHHMTKLWAVYKQAVKENYLAELDVSLWGPQGGENRDWVIAGYEWIQRRINKARDKYNGK